MYVCVSLKPLSADGFCGNHHDLQLKESVLCSGVFGIDHSVPHTHTHTRPLIHYFSHPARAGLQCAHHFSLNGCVFLLADFLPLCLSCYVFRLLPALKQKLFRFWFQETLQLNSLPFSFFFFPFLLANAYVCSQK